MISDILWDAESEIKKWLEMECSPYQGEVREHIKKLLAEMKQVRTLPGMDSRPTNQSDPTLSGEKAAKQPSRKDLEATESLVNAALGKK